MTINIVDIFILIPLLFFGYQGFKKGLIIEVTTLAALVLGLYLAFFFSDFAAQMLNDLFTLSEKYVAVLSFIMTFIVVIFLVITTGKIIQKFVDILLLGLLDKMAGAIFGLFKGALLLSILIFVMNYFDEGQHLINREARQKSLFYEPIESIAPALYSRLKLDHIEFDFPEREEIMNEII